MHRGPPHVAQLSEDLHWSSHLQLGVFLPALPPNQPVNHLALGDTTPWVTGRGHESSRSVARTDDCVFESLSSSDEFASMLARRRRGKKSTLTEFDVQLRHRVSFLHMFCR